MQVPTMQHKEISSSFGQLEISLSCFTNDCEIKYSSSQLETYNLETESLISCKTLGSRCA